LPRFFYWFSLVFTWIFGAKWQFWVIYGDFEQKLKKLKFILYYNEVLFFGKMRGKIGKLLIEYWNNLSEKIDKLETHLICDCPFGSRSYNLTLVVWKHLLLKKWAAIAAIAKEIDKLENLLIYEFPFNSDPYNETLLLWNELLLKKGRSKPTL
jgi:hypothetical protein